jgi:hypothetical protein
VRSFDDEFAIFVLLRVFYKRSRPTLYDGRYTMDVIRWTLYDGRYTMDVTRWTLHDGRYTMDVTRWTLHDGRYTMDVTRWTLYDGRYTMVRTAYKNLVRKEQPNSLSSSQIVLVSSLNLFFYSIYLSGPLVKNRVSGKKVETLSLR